MLPSAGCPLLKSHSILDVIYWQKKKKRKRKAGLARQERDVLMPDKEIAANMSVNPAPEQIQGGCGQVGGPEGTQGVGAGVVVAVTV